MWERYVVPALVSCACSTKPIMKQRQKIVPLAEGDVLELGCGSGTNFTLYDWGKVRQLHALEPAPGMVARAKRAAAQADLTDRIEFIETGAENAPLAANSIDTAVITFVLCTIPDWRSALEGVRRALKPGGRVVFTEHGLSPDAGVAKWQRRVEPVWKKLAGGCHLTRNSVEMMEAEGFEVERADTMYLPHTPKIAGYVSWGSARLA